MSATPIEITDTPINEDVNRLIFVTLAVENEYGGCHQLISHNGKIWRLRIVDSYFMAAYYEPAEVTE
jgi:hypothetical protein